LTLDCLYFISSSLWESLHRQQAQWAIHWATVRAIFLLPIVIEEFLPLVWKRHGNAVSAAHRRAEVHGAVYTRYFLDSRLIGMIGNQRARDGDPSSGHQNPEPPLLACTIPQKKKDRC
jgi:hypothetical protein